jgi:hypothetical protein
MSEEDKTEKPSPRGRSASGPVPSAPQPTSPGLVAVDYKPELVKLPAAVRPKNAPKRPPAPTRYAEPSPVAFGLPDGSIGMFTPGLNLVDAKTWSAASAHKEIAKLIEAKQVVEVNLAGLTPDEFTALISRTSGRAALEQLMEIEHKKPVIAGPKNRRNPELVEALSRKIAKVPRIKDVKKAG